MRVFDSRKLLAVSVLLLVSTLAVHGATSKETAVVKDVSFNPNGSSLEVTIATSERPQYTYFELSDPPRLVIDFHGNRNGIGFREKEVDKAGVERVRTSFFTDKTRRATRIVFDLTGDVHYSVTDDGDSNVRVTFGQRQGEGQRTKRAEPPRAPLSLIAGPPEVPASVFEQSPFEEQPLPSVPRVIAPLPVVAPEGPRVRQEPQPMVIPSSLGTQSGQPRQYSGEIVSIRLKDADIKDFFQFLSDFTGLNIVLDPAVSGTVTLTLNSVPWDQALDVVLKDHQLGVQLEGNVLRIARNDTLQAEENARKALKDAQVLAADVDTHTYLLNYTKTDAVATVLAKVLTPRGTIIPDSRRNALIVSDIPDQFVKIDPMIKFLDTPAQQVEIEGRLLSANKSFSRELGTQLGFVIGNRSQNSISGAPAVGNSPFIRNPPPSVTTGQGSIPLNVNLPAAATSGFSVLLGSGADILLDEIITAAEARGTAKLISKPHIVTQNNQLATVSQGTQIPVQTSQNNTVSTQFLNFSLKLTVTPQITDVGTILLNVQIENSQPDFARAVNGVPSVGTQAATTNVLIPDGGTAVIGGILIDTDTNNVRQVPGLGSIPLIGNLFKNTQMIKSTAELLFFVTARIASTDSLNITTPPGQK
jgi:type IV pilus assembly protein PilQ